MTVRIIQIAKTHLLAAVLATIPLSSCIETDDLDAEDSTWIGETELRTSLVDFGSGPVPITYEVRDGIAIYQDDMRLGPAEALLNDSYKLDLSPGVSQSFYGLIDTKNGPWPGARIPYLISSNVTEVMRGVIDQSILLWNSRSLIQFVPRVGNEHAVLFAMPADMPANICSATLGRQAGKEQVINLSAGCRAGSVLHEMGHTAGLRHEHSRWDRNQHITLDLTEVPEKYLHNFTRASAYGWWSRSHREYDPRSMMHYATESLGAKIARRTCDPTEEHDILRWQACGLGSSFFTSNDLAALTDIVINGQSATHLRPLNATNEDKCLAPVEVDVGEPTALVDHPVLTHPVTGQILARGDALQYSDAQAAQLRRGGMSVQVVQCEETPKQQWVQRKNPITNQYQIISKHYGECLAYYFDDKTNDEHLRLVACNNRIEQSFSKIGASADPLETLVSSAVNRCIDSSQSGPLRFVSCSSAGAQAWKTDEYSSLDACVSAFENSGASAVAQPLGDIVAQRPMTSTARQQLRDVCENMCNGLVTHDNATRAQLTCLPDGADIPDFSDFSFGFISGHGWF